MGAAGEGNKMTTNSGSPINPDTPQNFNMALADSLRNKGIYVRIMLHKPVMPDITLMPGNGDHLQLVKDNLKAIAKNAIWLNLSNNGLTDKDLDFLPLMTNPEN